MKTIKTIIVLFFLCTLLSSCCENGCKEVITTDAYEAQKNLISLAKAKSMHENYMRRIAPAVKQKQDTVKSAVSTLFTRDYKPTEYIWIDMEHLKDYIAFLEAVEEKNKDINKEKKISGIAIYLGAYDKGFNPEASDAERKKKFIRKGDYRGRETVFFNPTFINKGKDEANVYNHIPFKIRLAKDYKDKFVGIYYPANELNYPAPSDMVVGHQPEDTSLADNDLMTVPPM